MAEEGPSTFRRINYQLLILISFIIHHLCSHPHPQNYIQKTLYNYLANILLLTLFKLILMFCQIDFRKIF